MAGGAGFSSDDEVISGINVTPLVDVVLVLLVIFLITAPVIYQSAIKVQLPQTKTGDESSGQSPLEFTVTREGKVHWGKDELDFKTLEDRLKALGEKAAQETAIISADTATPHGTVVKLMDLLRQVGLTRFALNVEVSR